MALVQETERKRKRSLKQQIRDNRRLLSREDLPETVRQSKERIMNMLLEEMREKMRVGRERHINKRYKMVRFFERRKLTRRFRSCMKQLKNCTDHERDGLIASVQELRADINYTEHFPSGQKYIALFPTSSQTSDTALIKRAQLRQDIINQVDQGSLVDATNDLAPAPVSNTSCHKERELVSGVMEDGDPVPHKHSAASNSDTASSASTHVKKGTDKETKQHISRDRGGNRRDGRQRRGKLVRGTVLRTPSCHSKSSVEANEITSFRKTTEDDTFFI